MKSEWLDLEEGWLYLVEKTTRRAKQEGISHDMERYCVSRQSVIDESMRQWMKLKDHMNLTDFKKMNKKNQEEWETSRKLGGQMPSSVFEDDHADWKCLDWRSLDFYGLLACFKT